MGLNNFTTKGGGSAEFTDVDSDSITNSGQVTTQDLDVSGVASGTESAPGARATLTSDQPIPDRSSTTVEFDNIQFDDKNEFDPTTNTFTAQDSGRYLINTFVKFDTISDGTKMGIFVRVNGSQFPVNKNTHVGTTDRASIDANLVLNLNAGDSVEILVRQTSGGSVDLRSNNGLNSFSVSKIA
jgi:hypothetical protein